jgi:hypothetical protein
MMSGAEAIYRAWVILGIGAFFLLLAALQLWLGKAFLGYGWSWHPSPWFFRKKEPFQFWSHVGLLAWLGLFTIGLAATRLL